MTTCFVVQGKKTDFTDGRVLDLDALKVPAWMIQTTERRISSNQAMLVEIAQLSAQ